MVVPTRGSLLEIEGGGIRLLSFFFRELFDFYVFGLDQGLSVHPEIELRLGDSLFLGIGRDTGQVALRPVYVSYLAAIDIVFRGWDPQGVGQQVQGNKTFILAEFPELHRIYMLYFPGFFTGQIEYSRNRHALDDHPAAQIRKIEFLTIMGA